MTDEQKLKMDAALVAVKRIQALREALKRVADARVSDLAWPGGGGEFIGADYIDIAQVALWDDEKAGKA